jgi:hypothetical protein
MRLISWTLWSGSEHLLIYSCVGVLICMPFSPGETHEQIEGLKRYNRFDATETMMGLERGGGLY